MRSFPAFVAIIGLTISCGLSFSTMDETKSGTPDGWGDVTYKLSRAGKGITIAVTKITAELGGSSDGEDKFTGDVCNAKIERELNEVYQR